MRPIALEPRPIDFLAPVLDGDDLAGECALVERLVA